MNAQTNATLFDLRCPIVRSRTFQIREQVTGSRQVSQDFLNFLAKPARASGLHPKETDDMGLPVHILVLQAGQVGL
ncbi:MAG: hypothetical protein ACREDS_02540 [Limisphaerales bacterium]